MYNYLFGIIELFKNHMQLICMQQNQIFFMENYFVGKKRSQFFSIKTSYVGSACSHTHTAQVRERPTSKNIVPILTVHKNGKLGLWYIDLPAKRRWK